MNKELTKEQWKAIAEKLNGYLHKLCMAGDCETCAIKEHCIFVYKDHIDLARKELGYDKGNH